MVPWMTLTSSLVDIRDFGCTLWVSCGSGPLFTKLAHVLSYDLVNSRRSDRYASKFPIALILASHLDRTLYRCLLNVTFSFFPKRLNGTLREHFLIAAFVVFMETGNRLNMVISTYLYRISMLKIRQSHDRLIFDIWIPYLGKTVIILRRGPGGFRYLYRLSFRNSFQTPYSQKHVCP